MNGTLLDVLDVVEEVTTFNLFNTPTDNPNDEMDNADMETNLIAEEVEENSIIMRLMLNLVMKIWKHTHKTK